MPRVFLPYIELLWKRIPASLKEIKSAGFDGVECHLIGRLRSPQRVAELYGEATDLNLGVNLHQGWTWETGQPNFYNIILRAIGALVPVGTSLDKQIPTDPNPAIIYGNLVSVPGRFNYRYQTASEHVGSEYAMSFSEFTEIVKKRNLPIVFDTQHVLEWSQNVQGVEGLPTTSQVINNLVINLWLELHKYVLEIHLCDFNPQLGRSRGRNVFLGDGVFPFTEFCTLVRKSGWEGIVVPEVGVRHLRKAYKLEILRKKISQLFNI